VTLHAVARRYANALFDVAQRNQNVDALGRDLDAVRTLVASHDDLRRTLETPAIPVRNKRAIIEALLAQWPELSGEVRRLLLMLADHDRLMLIDEIRTMYTERLMQAARVASADVVTAVPLGASRLSALGEALGRATGYRVTVTERVDPSIVGGIVARVGSVVFDGSVTRQLERMRERLRSGA